MKLEDGLYEYDADVLTELMLYQGEAMIDSAKRINVVRLVKMIPAPERIKGQLDSLNEYERQALARLRQLGGSTTKSRLSKLLLGDVTIQPTPPAEGYYTKPYVGNPRYQGMPKLEDLLARLLMRGLVFTHTADQSSYGNSKKTIDWIPGRFVYMPDSVLKALDSADLPTLPDLSSIEPTYTTHGSVLPIQRDVNSYIRVVQRAGAVTVTSQNLLYKNDIKAIAADISRPSNLGSGRKESDNGYLFFLRRLLQDGQLLVRGKKGLEAADSRHEFFGMNSAERVQYIYHLYRDGSGWNGLRTLPSCSQGADIAAPAPRGIIDARRYVLLHLKVMGSGWVNTDGLLARIQGDNYGFLFPERSFTNYQYHGDKLRQTPYASGNNKFNLAFAKGAIQDEADGWDKVEGGWISHILAGPLHWLGLVDLGYLEQPPTDDLMGHVKPDGYRLTEFGEWVLGMRAQPETAIAPEEAGGLILQPNFEILAMEPLPVDVVMSLDAFTNMKDSQQHVSTFELTRESVYRGQQGQWTVEAIIDFFNEHGKMPVPDNVRRSLEEWAGLHKRITIRRNVRLVEVADAEIAGVISAEIPTLSPITETVMLTASTYREIATNISDAGYIPLKTGRNDTKARKTLQISDDGQVQFHQRTPSIFAQRELLPISLPLDDGKRQLDPALLRAETADGSYWHELYGTLGRLSSQELSAELVLNLKKWTHYYGNAAQSQLILIEFRNATARDELCADPELEPYLTSFAGDRALAVVSAEHVATVHKLLARRGVDVAQGLY